MLRVLRTTWTTYSNRLDRAQEIASWLVEEGVDKKFI